MRREIKIDQIARPQTCVRAWCVEYITYTPGSAMVKYAEKQPYLTHKRTLYHPKRGLSMILLHSAWAPM